MLLNADQNASAHLRPIDGSASSTSTPTTSQVPSYLPKIEANFMNNLTCCALTPPDLHTLLQHYEEVHGLRSPLEVERWKIT